MPDRRLPADEASDETRLRRLARLMLDADRAYAEAPCSVDAIMQVYDAQMQLETTLQRRPR